MFFIDENLKGEFLPRWVAYEEMDKARVLSEDGERLLVRCHSTSPTTSTILLSGSVHGDATPDLTIRLHNEFGLRPYLDSSWAAVPIEYQQQTGGAKLVIKDPGGELLSGLIGKPMAIRQFLELALALSNALAKTHEAGILHKDIKPSNILIDIEKRHSWLTGFGISSRLPRERHRPVPPEVIAGTFAYMAPEQTGRMNRSIDSRSDLYSLGVTLYQMLIGELPFTVAEPMEWIHCHIARQATPPSERRADVPEAISAIVMKLLGKAPEDRYRSATGLKSDLERCLYLLETSGSIPLFSLGLKDARSTLTFSEKLYGREDEVQRLLSAYERVVHQGAPEIVLVSGYSGIGKSSVVHELHKSLMPRDFFASGKFDQYKRDIPYATLAQAFQGLIRQLLSKGEDELHQWRQTLSQALGPNGQVLINLVPELFHVIGPQPPIQDLSGPEAQSRVHLAVKQFISVFARPEHPLVLFLDDLQWLDAATLDIFESLARHGDLGSILLVGAYRDNQVGEEHPLQKRLDGIRNSGVPIHEIILGGIRFEDVTRMIADAMEDMPENVTPLAQIVFDKTGGNPFFTTQFVATLVDDGLLVRAQNEAHWHWDSKRITSKRISDNIVDVLVQRIRRLPPPTQHALQRLACLGNTVKISVLQRIEDLSREETQTLLHDAFTNGLIAQIDDTFAFTHDRVHEAAHALIPPDTRSQLYHRVGFKLLDTLNDDEIETNIFDIVSLFNRGETAGLTQESRVLVASLNLRAARKAKAAAAYAAACDYLINSKEQLGSAGASQYELAFSLSLEHAECTFRCGDIAETKKQIASLLCLASTNADKAAVYRLKVEVRLVQSDNCGAVEKAIDGLRLLGIDLTPNPTSEDIQREYDDIWKNLNGRPIEVFADLPVMVEPESLAAMRLLAEMQPPAYFSSYNMTVLVICRMVNLSLTRGVASTSTQGLSLLGYIMGPVFGRYQEGYRIAKLASELALKRKAPLDIARVNHLTGLAAAWTEPLPVALEWLRSAFRGGVAAGDRYYACFEVAMVVLHSFQSGHNLEEVDDECRKAMEFARQTGFPAGIGVVLGTERAAASLRGRTRGLSNYGDDEVDEATLEAKLAHENHPIVARYYWSRKIMVHFLAEEYEAALVAAGKVHSELPLRNMQIEKLDYHYYSALAITALMKEASESDHEEKHAQVTEHYEHLRSWATEAMSPIFADKHVLIAAEIARIEGREMDAQRLYEESIRLARLNGFVQNEAIANEVASRYYSSIGFDKIAKLYLREARSCYSRWGAVAKVRQLDASHPHVRDDLPSKLGNRTTVSPSDQLDLATVIKIAQSVSGEIVSEKLLDGLMRTAIEHAGAERVVLVISHGTDCRVEAEAIMTNSGVTVKLQDESLSAMSLPGMVVQYVMHTKETVILDNAFVDDVFYADPYIRENRVHSLLALPLVNHGNLIGLLYLDNNLATNVFTPSRISILKLIASHAAIALENTRLYRDLEERESRIRRLVDSNVIGIVIWDIEGSLVDANDAFLRMVQYDREDLEAGLRWFDMTPPEWQEAHMNSEAQELMNTGIMQPREKEYYRKDGSRVPVLIGAAAFEKQPNQGVAYILDLTNLKQAEEAARTSELKNRELQYELAHANRIATVGQLSAAISHEVRQPLVGVVTSGSAGLNWLAAIPPNIPAAQRALERVIREGHRAADVLERTRDLVKKVPPKTELVSINTIISEAVHLIGSEADRKGVRLDFRPAEEMHLIFADRVQLQQVIVNLAMNAIEAMSCARVAQRELTLLSFNDMQGTVRVEVRDTGPGLPENDSNKIFDSFYSTKSEGMGMGLPISRSIVEAHGGELMAEKNYPVGAVFKFLLPVATASSQIPSMSPPHI